jgi:hypothetical protein
LLPPVFRTARPSLVEVDPLELRRLRRPGAGQADSPYLARLPKLGLVEPTPVVVPGQTQAGVPAGRRADHLGDVRGDEMGVVPLGHARVGVAKVRPDHRQRRSGLQPMLASVWHKMWKLPVDRNPRTAAGFVPRLTQVAGMRRAPLLPESVNLRTAPSNHPSTRGGMGETGAHLTYLFADVRARPTFQDGYKSG